MIKLKLDGRSPDIEGVTPYGKLHKIEVHVQTFVMSLEHIKMMEKAIEIPSDNENEQIARWVFYPALASCSTGDVPNEEEFLALPKKVVNEWFEVAMKLNPDLIEMDDGLSEDESLKKNKA